MSETFEANLKALEAAVEKLESGEEPLEASLKIYEEAVKRLKSCHELLRAAEGRVKILVPDGEGGFAERDFEAAEAE